MPQAAVERQAAIATGPPLQQLSAGVPGAAASPFPLSGPAFSRTHLLCACVARVGPHHRPLPSLLLDLPSGGAG